ncbi:MAG TPA: hypothetical protein VLI93_04205 [Acetobacteraceae bacterium]|nr:hypothetical protein [Acetobacteraceae bacterium]
MAFVSRSTALAGLAGIGVATLALLSGGSPAPPAQVTSDTQAYCRQLGDRVRELAPLATGPSRLMATNLAVEGQSLCMRGEIRGGIRRLRRAVRLVAGTAVRPH